MKNRMNKIMKNHMKNSANSSAGNSAANTTGKASLKKITADTLFRWCAVAAGVLILGVLAAVFVFLLIQASPVFVGNREAAAHVISSFTGGRTTSFLAFVGPLIFGTVLASALARKGRAGRGALPAEVPGAREVLPPRRRLTLRYITTSMRYGPCASRPARKAVARSSMLSTA